MTSCVSWLSVEKNCDDRKLPGREKKAPLTACRYEYYQVAVCHLLHTDDPWTQVTYCDEALMLTRQLSDSLSGSDLYVLWRRMKENMWNKY